MWKPYVDIVKTFFKNATIIIDKFHFMRYNIWAIEKVRMHVQQNMSTNLN